MQQLSLFQAQPDLHQVEQELWSRILQTSESDLTPEEKRRRITDLYYQRVAVLLEIRGQSKHKARY